MLVGSEERKAQQILRPYRWPCRERAVFSHQHAPNVRHRQLDEVVLRQIRRFDEDAEIHKPPVQPFRDVIRIAAEQVVRNVGVRRLEPVRRAGNQPHGVGLAASDMDITADGFFRRAELGFRLSTNVTNLLRPLGGGTCLPPSEKSSFSRAGTTFSPVPPQAPSSAATAWAG